MKKLLYFILFFSLLLPFNLYSQPQLEWAKTYNSAGMQDDNFVDMKIDGHGNTYITGYTIVSSSNYDIVTMKYSSSGNLEWVKTYDGMLHDFDSPVGIEIDKAGYIYVSGTTKDSIESKREYLLLKYNTEGNLIWKKKYNNSVDTIDNYNNAHKMVIDNTGNIFITGEGGGHGISVPPGIVTIKVDSSGNKLWTRYFKSVAPATDMVSAISIDSQGNIFIAGGSPGIGGLMIKYNSIGDSIFTKTSYFISGNKIFNLTDQNIILAAGNGLIKCDSTGNIIWSRVFRNPFSSEDFQVDQTLNIYAAGSVALSSGSKYVTVKFNYNGDSLWSRSYQAFANSYNIPTSIAIDKNQKIYVSGYVEKNQFSIRFLTVKYSQDSTFNWAIQYNNGIEFSDYEAKRILLDSAGNIYLAGISKTSGTDITLIKYSQQTSITHVFDKIPQKFNLSQNYPNPFNPETKIHYDLSKTSFISLNIYNSLGRKISSLVNKLQPAGNYTVNFNSNDFNLPSGIYFYIISFGEILITKKMILVK